MKKLLCILLTAVLLLGLTGCHGKREEKVFEIPEEFDTSRTYEISFWAKNDTNITQVEIYKKAIEDFQALYPNITVNLRLSDRSQRHHFQLRLLVRQLKEQD